MCMMKIMFALTHPHPGGKIFCIIGRCTVYMLLSCILFHKLMIKLIDINTSSLDSKVTRRGCTVVTSHYQTYMHGVG